MAYQELPYHQFWPRDVVANYSASQLALSAGTNKGFGVVFQASKSGNVKKVHFGFAAGVETSFGGSDITVGFYDESSFSISSGRRYIALASATPLESTLVSTTGLTSDSWVVAEFTNSVPIIEGDAYGWGMLLPGTSTASMSVVYAGASSYGAPYPYGNNPGATFSTYFPNMAIEFDDGSFMKVVNAPMLKPGFNVNTADIGYKTRSSFASEIGARFSPPENMKIQGVYLWGTASTFELSIYDSTDTVIYYKLFSYGGGSSTGPLQCIFDTTVELLQGEIYRMTLTGGGFNRLYQYIMPNDDNWYIQTFAGTTQFYQTYRNELGNWVDVDYIIPRMSLIISHEESGGGGSTGGSGPVSYGFIG